MESRLEEYREFFDGVMRMLATIEGSVERHEQVTPDEKARLAREVDQLERDLGKRSLKSMEYTPRELRRQIAAASAEELAGRRRFAAMTICMAIARGRTHPKDIAKDLKESLEHLRQLDAEIERRHLNK